MGPSKIERGKVFRDPVHGLIPISAKDDIIRELVDTKEFQRLRRVRQLGISSFTYPGAEHTRFAHSLGVYNFGRRILEQLLFRHGRESSLGQVIQSRQHIVQIACLLHDIGHGPFSHASEHIFGQEDQHEETSKSLILEEGSGVHWVLAQHLSDPEIEEIAGILDSHDYPFLHDIVSSQLDADRMDYLLRDSHHTGTRYGQYDSEWLLNSFCLGYQPIPEDSVTENRNTSLRLCLDETRGEHAAVQLVIARLHMSLQVYYHQKTRNIEAHLKCLFHEAVELASKDQLPPLTHPAVKEFFQKKGDIGRETFLLLDDSVLWSHFSYWLSCKGEKRFEQLAQWCDCLLYRNSLLEMHRFEPGQVTAATADLIGEGLRADTELKENRDWVIDPGKLKAYKAPKPRQLEEEPQAYYDEIGKAAIFLSSGETVSQARPLQHSSDILAGLGKPSTPLVRLFYRPEVAGRVKNEIAKLL